MAQPFSRTQLLLGEDAMQILARSRVAVFGVGGVGGYVVEALARSGVGALDIVDHDTISLTNLNRQILAVHSTLGQSKVLAAKARILDINPDCRVRTYDTFFLPETQSLFPFEDFDYVVDAIDTVTGKLALAQACQDAGTPLISSMGTGNKLDPTAFTVADIYETEICPLARVMRKECRKRGIEHLKVVYSQEEALKPAPPDDEPLPEGRRSIPGSTAFVPSVAGLILAGEVIKDLIKKQ